MSNNNNNNSQPNLTASQIKKATLLAVVSSFIIAIVAVLPAGYNKDFTGLGKALGFSRLYQNHDEVEEKLSEKTTDTATLPMLTLKDIGSQKVARPKEADAPAPSKQYAQRTDSIVVVIPANNGIEYKLNMLKHGQVKYAWQTSKGAMFFDLHGDVKENAAKNSGYYESYAVGTSDNMAGSFIAPFEGRHGWYFSNKTNEDIKVTFLFSGMYEIIK